jgi:hypothetical protein
MAIDDGWWKDYSTARGPPMAHENDWAEPGGLRMGKHD